MHDSHPLFGPSATVLWLEESAAAALGDFGGGEKWWSLRDAVKAAVATPRPGFKPWVKVDDKIFSPEEVHRAAAHIHEQDRADARRSYGEN
jgi:hypothetical protein